MDEQNEPPAPPFAQEIEASHRQLSAPRAPESDVAMALARTEIDSQIATAHAFPRVIGQAINNMIGWATMNPAIAEDCIYSLPRGGKQLRGPSIRFAEIAATAWGNLRDSTHIVGVDRIENMVICRGTCHDLETNRASSIAIQRKIEKKKGRQSIDDDMIQLAGMAGMSIARRNAILGVIPRFVWQQAIDAVEKVNRGDQKTLVERRDRAIAYFAKISVGIEKVLKALNKPTVEDIDLDDLALMNGWRVAITQGEASIDEIFPEERKASGKKDLAGQLDQLAGEGEVPSPAPLVGDLPADSEGAVASNLAQSEETGAAAPVAAPATMPSDSAAIPAQAQAEKPASAAPSAPSKADKSAERRARIASRGDAAAAKGHDALMEWLDNLAPDEAALITPAMEKDWKKAVEGKG